MVIVECKLTRGSHQIRKEKDGGLVVTVSGSVDHFLPFDRHASDESSLNYNNPQYLLTNTPIIHLALEERGLFPFITMKKLQEARNHWVVVYQDLVECSIPSSVFQIDANV